MEISRDIPKEKLDSVLLSCGFSQTDLANFKPDLQSADRWLVEKDDGKVVVLSKSLSSFQPNEVWDRVYSIMDMADFSSGSNAAPQVAYGVNKFRKEPTVKELADGTSLFFLKGNQGAKSVYLAGDFNNWSTLASPMTKTDSGWVKTLLLQEGVNRYKFIIDGKWSIDPENKNQWPNETGSFNSVYFKANHVFRLADHSEARKVILAGSFNDWDERELRMNAGENGWYLPIYLKEGTHAYKFIVDGKWITDPGNTVQRADDGGNLNSFVSIGDTFYFYLNGFLDEEKVVVSGDFNGWQTDELPMLKTKDGWTLPYVLAPGNYQYKFVVGKRQQWITDPGNPYQTKEGDKINSLLTVSPNQLFKLKGFSDAREVRISGDFNDWSEYGYTLQKSEDGWIIPLHLEAGKQRYKFIVDGRWIIDPNNKLWEQNEYGTGNSVLWVK